MYFKRCTDSLPPHHTHPQTPSNLRLYDMNGIFQMQGGKNRNLPKYCRSMQTGSSGTLIGWNPVKPLLSLYGTEWRERGYGLCVSHIHSYVTGGFLRWLAFAEPPSILYGWKMQKFKKIVRPDFICMGLVPLVMSWRNFLNFELEYLKRVQSSEPL
jgi:hypothetical protein